MWAETPVGGRTGVEKQDFAPVVAVPCHERIVRMTKDQAVDVVLEFKQGKRVCGSRIVACELTKRFLVWVLAPVAVAQANNYAFDFKTA